MAYTPPVGTANLSIGGVPVYNPPVGTTNLSIGFDASLSRSAAIAGILPAPTGFLRSAYDPNLLSGVVAMVGSQWQDGDIQAPGTREGLQEAVPIQVTGSDAWQDSEAVLDGTDAVWQQSGRLEALGADAWQDAAWKSAGTALDWLQALRIEQGRSAYWQDAESRKNAVVDRFKASLPLFAHPAIPVWQHGANISIHVGDGMQDGLRLISVEIEVWQPGGYPGNAPNPGPLPPPLPAPWPWGTNLHLRCPLPGTRLRLWRSPCIQIAERELPILPSYLSVNSASLVLLPERTVLPCTSMTIQTDSGSWGWQLDASLSGPEVFDLIKPFESGYPREVEATINGWKWTFVLEIPNRDQTFNRTNLRCTGWSTSLWLDDPYTLATTGRNAEARTANQLAEEALENTGWTLAWDLDDWLVPARRFEWENTKLGRVKRILRPVNGCLYTHPYLKIMTAYPKYRIPSWLWGSETADIDIPNSLIISLKSEPNFSPTYNGVYISGTSHGVLAWVKVTGTDGMTQPDQPIVEALCCDNNGVAARMAGIAFLSSCGLGWTVTLDTVLGTNPALQDLPPLIVPGQLVSYNTHKAMVRGVSINASRSGGYMGLLSVRQRLELERREIEP